MYTQTVHSCFGSHRGEKKPAFFFFLPLFMSLFQHIETGGLRGFCDASQNSCLHERVFIFLFTCKFADFFTLSALNLLLLLWWECHREQDKATVFPSGSSCFVFAPSFHSQLSFEGKFRMDPSLYLFNKSHLWVFALFSPSLPFFKIPCFFIHLVWQHFLHSAQIDLFTIQKGQVQWALC